ncbi:MAG: DUF4838 domain-containing protein [Candidatus Anammoximicrobium sp.]|nr:DUF4838 domain-containing protein [Candidatus Anammoximicrobium sp.]
MVRHAPRYLVVLFVMSLAATAFAAPLRLAGGGKTTYSIVVDPDAIAAEQHAAAELAALLKQVTGADFPVQTTVQMPAGPLLVVGPGRVARQAAPSVSLDGLQPDGIVIETVGENVLLAGDRPRGTLYAVYSFLEDAVGCRWWSSKVSSIPRLPDLTVPEQHVRYVPPLEYRETFWADAFDGDWAARNKSNGDSERLADKHGGRIRYGGPSFVHTFAHLVPPATYFQEHPEYFSEVNGQRLDGYAQVCVTNEAVKKLITDKVLAYLRDDPTAQIISVSQNDCDKHCLCANCKRLEEEEGSPAGPLLHLVNHVAAEVGKQYPEVAIDTLAYQYTRQPPRHVKPLPNVIVRLCSIECDFARPLTAESNRKFADDIRGWSKICQRVYIWDYTTNFAHYIQPHPNLRVLGSNIRFFVDHGVRGIFEQGAYTSQGAEFAELKAWVLAKLLWNPRLDDQALVREFVHGYYGAAAAPMREYIELIHDEAEAKNTYLTCFSSATAEFLNLAMLARAEKLLDQAEAAVKDDPAVLHRVQVARLPLRYVWATRWYEFQDQAAREKTAWPGPADYAQNCRTFLEVAKAAGVSMISEGAQLAAFERRTIALGRTSSPPPPGCENLPREQWIDLPDATFNLAAEGTWATIEKDELAVDKTAARMPGNHYEWAVQQGLLGKPLARDAIYDVYASIRVEKTGNDGPAFSAGIYDAKNRAGLGHAGCTCAEIADDQYHVYKLGSTRLHGDVYLWAAPPRNPDNVRSVWVDRFWLVKAKAEAAR